MKKLLLSAAVLALLSAACGTTPEEKQAKQEANEEAVDAEVNKIMDQLEASAAESEEAETMEEDTTQASEEMTEEAEAVETEESEE